MPIVATTDTRNSQWANDPSSFGRKMLAKMGWKGDGSGLGKTQQGTSTHLRAVRRAESLGIGAENDAFGEKGWSDTNAGFHGVLANLKREYSSVGSGSNNSSDREDSEDVEGGTKQKKKKRKRTEDEKKQKKEKRSEKRSKKKNTSDGTSDKNRSSGNDATNNTTGLRLPQNKVQAGHARKMRQAKDIRNKSAEDMAAIFGVKADFYQKPREWVTEDGVADGGDQDSSSDKVKEKRKSKKKSKRSSETSDTCNKEDKNKRKRSTEGDESKSTDRLEPKKSKSKR
ncbi:hypothetical protein ACHAXH_008724 [Discostella pseudostelligera]